MYFTIMAFAVGSSPLNNPILAHGALWKRLGGVAHADKRKDFAYLAQWWDSHWILSSSQPIRGRAVKDSLQYLLIILCNLVHCRLSYPSLVAVIGRPRFEDSNEPDLKRFYKDWDRCLASDCPIRGTCVSLDKFLKSTSIYKATAKQQHRKLLVLTSASFSS